MQVPTCHAPHWGPTSSPTVLIDLQAMQAAQTETNKVKSEKKLVETCLGKAEDELHAAQQERRHNQNEIDRLRRIVSEKEERIAGIASSIAQLARYVSRKEEGEASETGELMVQLQQCQDERLVYKQSGARLQDRVDHLLTGNKRLELQITEDRRVHQEEFRKRGVQISELTELKKKLEAQLEQCRSNARRTQPPFSPYAFSPIGNPPIGKNDRRSH